MNLKDIFIAFVVLCLIWNGMNKYFDRKAKETKQELREEILDEYIPVDTIDVQMTISDTTLKCDHEVIKEMLSSRNLIQVTILDCDRDTVDIFLIDPATARIVR